MAALNAVPQEAVTIPPDYALHSMTPTRRIATTWYAYGYLREVVLIYPVYAIMMGEHGVSPLELSTLFFVWSASALIFEVPSGVLADRYSRKRLLVISGVLKGAAFIPWWFAPDFSGYLTGFVVWSMGSSLVSGTSESFLYDTLRTAPHAKGEDRGFARIYGRGMVASSFGVATALAGGGYLAEHGYAWPLALSIAAPWFAALIVAIAFVEPPRGDATRHENVFGTLAAGVAEVRRSRVLLYIVAMFATLVTAYGVIDEYLGPFLNEKPAFTLGAVGLVYAASFTTRTIGMEVAHRLPFRSLRAIANLFAIGTLGLGVTALTNDLWLVVTYGWYFAASSAAEVLLQTRLQHEIDGSARATVTSIAKMAQHGAELLFYLYIGTIAQLWSFQTALAAVAVLTFTLAIVFAAMAPARSRWTYPGISG